MTHELVRLSNMKAYQLQPGKYFDRCNVPNLRTVATFDRGDKLAVFLSELLGGLVRSRAVELELKFEAAAPGI